MAMLPAVDDSASMRQRVVATLKGADYEAGDGATGWLVNPFNPEQLISMVKRVPG